MCVSLDGGELTTRNCTDSNSTGQLCSGTVVALVDAGYE